MKQRGGAARMAVVGIAVGLACVAAAVEGANNAPGTTGLLEAVVGGKRTLVLADGPRIQDSHSMFFDDLQVRSQPARMDGRGVLLV